MRAALRRFPLQRAIQAAIVATIVTALLAGGALLSWLETARKLRWVALFALLALAVAYLVREGPRRAPIALAPAAVFAVLAVASAAWSASPVLVVEHGLTIVVLFAACGGLAVAAAGRPAAVGQLVWAILAAVAVVAIGGLLVLAFRHDRALSPATTALPVRYQGLGGGPNTAMMLIAVGLPLAAHAVVEARRKPVRVAAVALFLLLAGSLIASGSRGALASAFGGLLAYALLAAPTPARRLGCSAAVVLMFVVGVLLTRIPQPLKAPAAAAAPPVQPAGTVSPPPPPGSPFLPTELTPRLQDDVGRPPFGVGDTERRPRTLLGTSGRAEAWRGALEQVAARPLVGYGFGLEDRVFVDRYVFFNSNVPENSYIGLLLQVGVVGTAAFFVLVAALAAGTARAVRRLRAAQRRLVAACAGGFVVGLLLACFQSFIYAVGNNATAAVWLCGFLLAAASVDSAAEHA